MVETISSEWGMDHGRPRARECIASAFSFSAKPSQRECTSSCPASTNWHGLVDVLGDQLLREHGTHLSHPCPWFMGIAFDNALASSREPASLITGCLPEILPSREEDTTSGYA